QVVQSAGLTATNQPTPFDISDNRTNTLDDLRQSLGGTLEDLGRQRDSILPWASSTLNDLGSAARQAPGLGGLGDLIDEGRRELPPPTTGPSGEPIPDIGGGLQAAMQELQRQQDERTGANRSLLDQLLNVSNYVPGGAADPGGVLSA